MTTQVLRISAHSISIALTLCLASVYGANLPRDFCLEHEPSSRAASVVSTTDTIPVSNSSVDIVYAAPEIWAATAKGVGRRTLPGGDWITYGAADDLAGIEIPAIGVFGSGVWSATSHPEVHDGRSIRYGDGLFRFNALTEKWEERTPADGQASGPFQLAYDLAETRGMTLAGCFAGGLVMSSDAGASWSNIFIDATARIDFENEQYIDLNNRYFALAVDSTRPESLSVYAGTAYGINKFTYLHDTLKPTGLSIADLYVDGARLYAATERGLMRSPDRGGTWKSFYQSTDGFPSDNVISVAAVGDTIWTGFASADGLGGLGLAFTTNRGGTWTVTQPSAAMGTGRRPVEIIVTGSQVYVACEDGGLANTGIAGGTWDIDSSRTTLSMLLVPDGSDSSLYTGTDNGIYILQVGVLRSVGLPADNISQRVVRLGLQNNSCTTAVWALCEADGLGATDGFAVTIDEGLTWDVSTRRIGSTGIVFEGCRFYLASDSGLAEGNISNPDSLMYNAAFAQEIENTEVGLTLRSIAAELGKDQDLNDIITTLWVGTDSLIGYSGDRGIKWAEVFSNPNPLEFDLKDRYNYLDVDTSVSGFEQLSGNFITALGFQSGGRGAIWASTQATGQGRSANTFVTTKEKDGISVTRDAGRTWSVPLIGHQVWNFAFDNQIIWAASSQGLLRSPNNGVTWDTLKDFTDPITGAMIDSSIEVFAVEIVDDEVWVGTENGYAFLDRNGSTLGVRRYNRAVSSVDPGGEGGAYATPVPYGPRRDAGSGISAGPIRFHFTPPTTGEVTIKIYDYANNLVKELTGDETLTAGVQSDDNFTWDARNGEGDVVAVGTYFFVIEYSGGETHWGKLVVIP